MTFSMSNLSDKPQKNNPLLKLVLLPINEKHSQLIFPKPKENPSLQTVPSNPSNWPVAVQVPQKPVPVNLITTGTQSRDLFSGNECPFLVPEIESIFAQKKEEKREREFKEALVEKINISSYTKKTILSGKILETYTYSRPQKKAINITDFSKQTKQEATPENQEKNRKESLYRAKKKLKRIINSNVDQGKNADVFLTLTFRENIQNVQKANRYLTLFIQRLRNFLLNKKGIVLKYTCCIEFQRRGAIHYHLSLFDFPFIHATILEGLWGYGYVKLKKLSSQADIGSYMTKYLTKNADTDKLKGQKTYWTSRGLEKPLVILGFSNVSKRAIEILEKETSKKLLYYFSFNAEHQGYTQYSKHLLETNSNKVRSRLEMVINEDI